MKHNEISDRIYKKFSEKDGNDHIAGDYALEKILRFITQYKCSKILEIGLGIGSISDAILNYAKSNSLKIDYTGTEANEFCLNALKQNVDDFEKINLYSSLDNIPVSSLYDLIIVDGSDEALSKIKKHCTKHAMIFIEGGRASQIKTIQQIFPNLYYVEVISNRKPPAYGPFNQKWTGGGSLIAVNPTTSQKVSMFFEKVKTFTKRRLRKFA